MTAVARQVRRSAGLAVPLLFWAAVLAYVMLFSALSLQQYHAYLPHALDLGNMAQAAWNTAHGHPLVFQNQRLAINFEAFNTSTRLSAHVEPIFFAIACLYFFWQHVETLLVLQTVGIAAGAIPARLLARRYLGPGLPELVFPLAYLLFPTLEAANLDEFHPVVFAAPLLMWAIYLADSRRYTLFSLAALAALGCKEELGMMVAAIALIWIVARNGDRRFGFVVAAFSLLWTLIAVKIVVPHFNHADSSYWARYVPPDYDIGRYPVTPGDVLTFWLQHPGQALADLASEAKRGYLHRLLLPTGYLSLFNPLALLAAIPSLLLVLLSYEPHMYGGVSHYSAELVPVIIASSLLGVKFLSTVLPRLHVPAPRAIAVCSLYLLGTSLANHRANGFTPLAAGFSWPSITAHDRLLDAVLAAIPAGASVSAQDSLNAHLSDRGHIFLYPDLDNNNVDYVVLDATQGLGSVMRPCDLYSQVLGDPFPEPALPSPCAMAINSVSSEYASSSSREAVARGAARSLLHNGRWSIQFAQDGILVLQRRPTGTPPVQALPPSFYSFVTPAGDAPGTKVRAQFGEALQLEDFAISRREQTNLRDADIVVTTWWRVLKRPTQALAIMHYLTDSTGALQVFSSDQQATDWLPVATWQPGQTYKVRSSQLTVTTKTSGPIDIDIAVTTSPRQYANLNVNLRIRLQQSGPTHLEGSCACRLLRLTSVPAQH